MVYKCYPDLVVFKIKEYRDLYHAAVSAGAQDAYVVRNSVHREDMMPAPPSHLHRVGRLSAPSPRPVQVEHVAHVLFIATEELAQDHAVGFEFGFQEEATTPILEASAASNPKSASTSASRQMRPRLSAPEIMALTRARHARLGLPVADPIRGGPSGSEAES